MLEDSIGRNNGESWVNQPYLRRFIQSIHVLVETERNIKSVVGKDKVMVSLQFIFTEQSFFPEGKIENLSENDRVWLERFELNRYEALYRMGLEEKSGSYSPSAAFLYLLSDTFFKVLTSISELELARENIRVLLADDILEELEKAVPFAIGAEHITREWIGGVVSRLNDIFSAEIVKYEGSVQMYLTEKSQHLRVPERIFFHLVENKDAEFPFAFLATYATKGEDGQVRHMPLKYALTEFGNEREKLLTLLSCLNQAAEVSELIAGFMENGELFHPLRLTSGEAYTFLKSIEEIEHIGILCRIPNWWKKKSASVSMAVSLGEKKPAMLGFDTLVSVQPKLMVDGVPLTESDIKKLLAQTDGLAFLKGKWVEVDHKKLKTLLMDMEKVPEEMTLKEALRMELGTGKEKADVGQLITNGKWLSSLLQNLRRPESIRKPALPSTFCAKLRPYQDNGFAWLSYMDKLGFGACLADDMGLGKTVQVLAYLEKMRKAGMDSRALLVVPASLIGNWEKEAEKFTPKLDLLVLHGRSSQLLEEELKERQAFLVITTYGMVSRVKGLQEVEWDCLVLDEAQAIKNPVTKQTKEIKKINARMRIAMTGTPIENDLTNLWSLFDFLNKGLMGTSKEFHDFCKNLSEHPEGYAHLRTMVAPFMLRRVKTDNKIIADLPEKLEKVDYTELSKKQVVLYRKVIEELEKKLNEADGMERRGLVLAALTKLKQICNHPDQYLGQQTYAPADSGKFAMLREICETIYEKRERVLVFTQFKEITEYLAAYLARLFGMEGYVLHGGTPVARRGKIVEAFQGEKYVPFIVLSVKAGGTGLNLTKANHVIHFDRWWNPAVENQATDRAFRIGQTKNVMVHKLVCEGTIEEKIDAMIESKKELAENVIGSGGEKWITELGNDELMRMLRLDAN